MTDPADPWSLLDAALDAAAEAEHIVDVWLRDDDAIADSPPLQRLTTLCEGHGMPVLLAVIPAHADDSLRRFVDAHPLLTPTQHGFAHRNHAGPGERAREIGGTRPSAATLADLAEGRDRLGRLFGQSATNILVPPWNKIDDALLAALPDLGFRALSTFGPPRSAVPDLLELNCDLDIIDWRGGRVCHPLERLVGKLVPLVQDAAATGRPIGLLTHHLAHDEGCWTFLDACLARFARHRAVRLTTADVLLSRVVVSRAWDDEGADVPR